MANPGVNEGHIDSAMSRFSLRYTPSEYIGEKVVPFVPVVKSSDKYFIWDQADEFRDDAGHRAPGTPGPAVGQRLSNSDYTTEQRSALTWINDETRRNADAGLNLDRNAARLATAKVKLNYELDIAALLFTSGNYTNSAAVSTVWTDDSSDIYGEWRTARQTVLGAMGKKPTDVIVNDIVLDAVSDHAHVRDRGKHVGADTTDTAWLAKQMGVKRVWVAESIYNTSEEDDTAVYARVWGNHCAFLYLDFEPSMDTLSFAHSFLLNGAFQVDTGREDLNKRNWSRTIAEWDAKVTAASAGYLLTTAV